jgi:GNAT superfamily N-acetyltransferase
MVTFRRAELGDVPALVALRMALMDTSMDTRSPAATTALTEAMRVYFERTLPTEEFLAWVAEADGEVVAASGLVMFDGPPSDAYPTGREAYVMNMYTLPAWRGKGLASALVQRLMEDAEERGAQRMWLRATDQGRPIYERASFTPNERYMERLLDPS